MAAVPKLLHRASITGTTLATVTVPAGKRWVVTNVILSNVNNVTANSATVLLDDVALFNSLVIQPLDIFTLDCTQVVNTSMKIQAQAGSNLALSIHISGVELDV